VPLLGDLLEHPGGVVLLGHRADLLEVGGQRRRLGGPPVADVPVEGDDLLGDDVGQRGDRAVRRPEPSGQVVLRADQDALPGRVDLLGVAGLSPGVLDAPHRQAGHQVRRERAPSTSGMW
jgi:hypothetical protein